MANHAWTKWPWKPDAKAICLWLEFEAARTGGGFVAVEESPECWELVSILDKDDPPAGRGCLFINDDGGLETRHRVSTSRWEWWLKGFVHASTLRAFGGSVMYDEGVGSFFDDTVDKVPDAKASLELEKKQNSRGAAMARLLFGRIDKTEQKIFGLNKKGPSNGWPGADGFAEWLGDQRARVEKKQAGWLLLPFAATGKGEPPKWLLEMAAKKDVARALAVSVSKGHGLPAWLSEVDLAAKDVTSVKERLLREASKPLDNDKPGERQARIDGFGHAWAAIEESKLESGISEATGKARKVAAP